MWQPRSSRPNPDPPADDSHAPAAVPDGALAIWARQIENARQQTESSITDLAGNFGDLVQKMDGSIAQAQRLAEAYADQAEADGQQAEHELSSVLEALREMRRSRDALTEEMGAIVSFTAELQRMAEDVRMIAFQTQMLTLNAARMYDAGMPIKKEASIAKYFAAEASLRVCDKAIEILGGYGYLRDFPVERYLRDARVHQILEGTNEIMRLIVARRLLGG